MCSSEVMKDDGASSHINAEEFAEAENSTESLRATHYMCYPGVLAGSHREDTVSWTMSEVDNS